MSIDDAYNKLEADRALRAAEKARAAAVDETRRRARMEILNRARGQVFGTTSHVIQNSSFSGALKANYCGDCPCIWVGRKDEDGLAARVEIQVDAEGVALMKLGDLGWVNVDSNAPALRDHVSSAVAADLLERPMKSSPMQRRLEKYALWGVLAIPVGFVAANLLIGLFQAAGAILLIIAVIAIVCGMFKS